MVAAVAVDSTGTLEKGSVSRFFYVLMVVMSLFFIMLMIAPFFLRPLLQFDLVALLDRSKWWIGIPETVVMAGLSVIYPHLKKTSLQGQ
jgi:hypothetical protein